jgi:hypothetical protein
LQPRVAKVSVVVDVPDADIAINDLSVGKSPLEKPLRVNSGRVKITVTAPRRAPVTRVLEIAGGETATVRMDVPDTAARTNTRERPIPWAAWGTTAALAVGAGAFGVAALKASNDYDDTLNHMGADPDTVDAERNRLHALAIVTDVLAGAAVVAGGISLYLTLKKPSDEAPKRTRALVAPSSRGGWIALERAF